MIDHVGRADVIIVSMAISARRTLRVCIAIGLAIVPFVDMG